MTSTSIKNIVVFGGTGAQGSAFIKALAEHNAKKEEYAIYLLSRNVTAGGSVALGKLPGVRVVAAGEYAANPLKAFKDAGLQPGEIHGVFSVQGYMSEEEEIKQGELCLMGWTDSRPGSRIRLGRVWRQALHLRLDRALGQRYPARRRVSRSSRFANGRMDAKRNIEKAIKATSMGWTMLRDSDFMDNWVSDKWELKVYRTVILRKTYRKHPERTLPMISCRDIGRAAVVALTQPEKYLNKNIILAADLLTTTQIMDTFKSVMGYAIPETWGITASLVRMFDKTTNQLSTVSS